ncbi:hypothetical protein ABIE44_001711 [Marmoricola sp. OAE513]|uniref:hypothetical protein n=1 Tax=Marmoricola sp. OAE513 TaxID=2817894 RepID=UPI001AE2F376
MTSRTRLGALAAVLTAALVLSGCGGDDDSEKPKASDEGTTKVVLPDASGEVTAKVDGDGDGIKITNEDGETVVGKGLPDGFPKDEIPIVDGDVVGGTKGNAAGPYSYTVLLQLDSGSPASVMADITRSLKAKGFAATPGMSVDQMSTAIFRSSKYEVGVNVVRADSKISVTYVVKRAA